MKILQKFEKLRFKITLKSTSLSLTNVTDEAVNHMVIGLKSSTLKGYLKFNS